jgi:hypothetical protein
VLGAGLELVPAFGLEIVHATEGNMRGMPAGWLARALALGLLAGCGEGTSGPAGEGTATVRLMNAALGNVAYDLLVGGRLVAGGVQYQQASPNATVPGGTQILTIRRAGEQGVAASRTTEFLPGHKYAVLVSGSPAAPVLTPSAVVDTGNARPDRANLRIINISTIVMPQDSAQMPPPIPLNVFITAPGVPLEGAASPLSVDARISSYSTLMYFDPGTLVVRFVTPGTAAVVAETVAFSIAAGQIRAITLQRQPDGSWRTSVVAEQ